MSSKIILLSIGILSVVFAQVDSTTAFYPMETGNMWQYWYHYKIGGTSISESTYVTIKIVGDTLMPNGKWYKIFDGPILSMMQTKYQRMDTISASVFCYVGYPVPTERLTDSLRAQLYDTFGRGIRCTAIDTSTILGTRTITKTFVPASPFTSVPTFAYGLGITRSYHSEDNPVYNYDNYIYDLVYAKINGKEYGMLTNVTSEQSHNHPIYFGLRQNYPNPFNPTTKISFSLPSTCYITLNIYDVMGRLVDNVLQGRYNSGEYSVDWNGTFQSSGVYFYKLQADNNVEVKKMLLQK